VDRYEMCEQTKKNEGMDARAFMDRWMDGTLGGFLLGNSFFPYSSCVCLHFCIFIPKLHFGFGFFVPHKAPFK